MSLARSRRCFRTCRRARGRGDWTDVRLAVMAGPLSAEFARHPEPAAVLRGTGDARIGRSGCDGSPYRRTARDDAGRDRVGRLPGLVRSEVFAAGVSSPTGE